MDYSIIIPTFRPAESLRDLTDELASAEPGVPVIITSKQGSPAFNRNAGLNATETPAVVMVDDDTRDLPRFFARDLVASLIADSRLVIVSAKLINPDGRVFMGGRFPKGETGVDLSLVGWAPSACFAAYNNGVRFDESLPCFEDVDYCFQLTATMVGVKFAVNNDVRVRHLNRETWRKDDAATIAAARFKAKWGMEIPH